MKPTVLTFFLVVLLVVLSVVIAAQEVDEKDVTLLRQRSVSRRRTSALPEMQEKRALYGKGGDDVRILLTRIRSS